MEKLICIDFGSSYTKVAVRRNWKASSELLRDLGRDEGFSFCIPSTVACVKRNGRFTWLIGEDALSQSPGNSVRLYQNWKGKMLSETGADSDYEAVATHFFQGLQRQLVGIDPRLSKLPIRICIPRLENESEVERQMLDVLEIAGVRVAESKPCLFEPEANIYGTTTRGRNVAWRPPKSPLLEPHYGRMFERDRGGLFDELRKASRKLDDFQYTILVVDVGSFTADFGCVSFAVSGGEIDDFKTPDVVQKSQPIGIMKLDDEVLGVLRPEVRQAVEARPFRVWEDIKRRIYNGHEAAVRGGRGMLIIGENDEAENIATEIDIYAEQLVSACAAFCRRHDVTPKKAVLTGGGALITGLRERVVAGLVEKLSTSMYDLLDDQEPYQVLLPKPIEGGGWRWDQKEVDDRLRTNRDLIRGGSAIGGCSVFIDLPITAPKSKSRKMNV